MLNSPGRTNGLKGEFSSCPSSWSSSSSSSLGCAPPPVSSPVSLLLSLSPSGGCLSPSVTVLFSLSHGPLALKPSSPEAAPSSGPTRARISLCLCGWRRSGMQSEKRLKEKLSWHERHCSSSVCVRLGVGWVLRHINWRGFGKHSSVAWQRAETALAVIL